MPTFEGKIRSVRNYWHQSGNHGKLVRVQLTEGVEFRLLTEPEQDVQLALVLLAASAGFPVKAAVNDDGVCLSLTVSPVN